MLADVTRALGTDYYLIEELLTDEEREIRDSGLATLLPNCC